MFSSTLRLLLAAMVVVLFATSSASARPVAHTGQCAKHYKVFHAKRAISVVYAGRRHVTRADSGLLSKIERCQRNKRDKAYVHQYRAKKAADWRLRRSMTDFVIEGYTSTFGPPREGDMQTADGVHTTQRMCIATRYSSLLGRQFLLVVDGKRAIVIMCDWGPAAWTGRDIDITGFTLLRMGISPYGYSNGLGRATLLK